MPPGLQVPICLAGMALGAAIGWIVIFFLHRFKVFNAQVLGAVVSVVAGGTVVTFLGTIGSEAKLWAWIGYCMGLCFGVVIFSRQGVGEMQSESRDPRLKMIDDLHSRYVHSKLSREQYEEAKGKILAAIAN